MKKISLKTIDNQEILSREELKNIMGGFTGSGDSGFSSCTLTCDDAKKTKLSKDCGYGVSCSTDKSNIYCGGEKAETCPS
ncbi:hypothetical protein [Sphingobacterium multivorum]|uniref:Uncharacterized protein n=1 Tax=Sphingobacterium multivorum TaxID=28454 RepID=A0A2X2LRH2_SPHMU|nr:hypothetical protein [Sphingobacterium multivorum]QRQ60046.1 hypothetical protein I6J33_18065 [Sphingobacterium multivorum]SPZ92080.1 Uncharacterised protein [Sphingobacterium multivorum]